MVNNLCVIPARGGSKRIEKKNIKDFLGKPIIAYSIETALKSNLFQKIIVSTEDTEIASVAKKYGANILMRTVKNSDDFATLSDVVEEVKEHFKASEVKIDNICCFMATAPLVTPALLKQGYDLLIQSNADSVRPIAEFDYPIQRALKMEGSKISFYYAKYRMIRSQDLERAYHDAGMFYWMKFQSGLLGENRHAFSVPRSQAQDIDSLSDWSIAELKYKIING